MWNAIARKSITISDIGLRYTMTFTNSGNTLSGKRIGLTNRNIVDARFTT